MSTSIRSRDLRSALDVLNFVGDRCAGSRDFARRGVRALNTLVAADLTTLSVCDLDSGHRSVVGNPSAAIGRREIEVFDHYFHEHPLIRAHGRKPGAGTYRISDLVPKDEFLRSPLYNEYYRPIRIDHVMAVPVLIDERFLVSFVLNRSGRRGFDDHDLTLLELMRPQLSNLYRLAVELDRAAQRSAAREPAAALLAATLTAREREVLGWVSAGKTNGDVALILGARPRTVEKHLERIFVKLGVETRTAAAMRSRPWRPVLPDLS